MTPAIERLERIRRRPVVLGVHDLGLTYPNGARALEGITFDVHRREFLTVIGPSGCGKSTLIRVLAGLETPTAGTVTLDGRPVEGPGPDRGMVFQGYTLFPWLTVLGNVMFGLRMQGVGHDESRSQALEWIELVGLAHLADAWPYQLSGGQQQRVAIARALAAKPRILLMDEPFGALDAQTRAHLQEHLLAIWRHVNITILFITHDLDEAVWLADRVVVLGAPDASHRSGWLQEVVEVPLPQPRLREHQRSPEFAAVRARLEHLIHPPVTAPAERLPVFKLTQVGDEVD
jgi:NitT/TauT family transport system ATP-binding protein